jgi:hypothetical protein
VPSSLGPKLMILFDPTDLKGRAQIEDRLSLHGRRNGIATTFT